MRTRGKLTREGREIQRKWRARMGKNLTKKMQNGEQEKNPQNKIRDDVA